MTGTVVLRTGGRHLSTVRASEGRVVGWLVQALLPWVVTVVHPSFWSLAAASAQVLLGGSLVLSSVVRLRLLARAALLLLVVGHGIDLSQLSGALVHLLVGGLETVAVLALMSVVRRHTPRLAVR